MSVFKVTTLHVGHKLAELTNLIKSVARERPNDQAAQLRAQAAHSFYCGVADFPKLSGDNDASESPALSECNLDNDDGHRLPTEIYQLIIDHLGDFDHATAQKTLVALASSCKLLNTLAQRRLYAYPRELETIERQWQFRFSLAVEPDIGSLVKSLRVYWLPTGENSALLIDICQACPNMKELLIHRGKSLDDPNQITRKDVFNMAALLDASPHVTAFWYSTIVEWTPEELRYEGTFRGDVFEKSIERRRFEKAASKLADLTFYGQTQWLLRALLPHLSPNFTSLTLGQDVSLHFNLRVFSDLSQRSPYLRELEVRCITINVEDLVEACKTWGPTLETLCISSVGEATDWVPKIMPSMTVLKELSLGPGCYIFASDLDAIVKSLPAQRFESISFHDLQYPEDTVDVATTQASMDDCLTKLVRTHSSTLKSLEINGGRFRVGRAVLHSCKEATGLESLWVSTPPDIKSADLDDLFDNCPRLADISERLLQSSAHRIMWEVRIVARQNWQEEEMNRDVNVRDLGI